MLIKLLPILGIVILIGALVGSGYYFIQPANKSISTSPPSPYLENIASSAAHVVTTNNFYSIEYPTNWKSSEEKFDDRYPTFLLRSPDYLEGDGKNEQGEFIQENIEKGAEIRLSVQKSEYNSLDEYLNVLKSAESDQLSNIILKGEQVQVDGVEAIQYSYSFEGTEATHTVFFTKGVEYSAILYYGSDLDKQRYWADYQKMLKTFKFGK